MSIGFTNIFRNFGRHRKILPEIHVLVAVIRKILYNKDLRDLFGRNGYRSVPRMNFRKRDFETERN